VKICARVCKSHRRGRILWFRSLTVAGSQWNAFKVCFTPPDLQRAATYATAFLACALTFAHRFFAALAIAARPAADKTRFLTTATSRSAEWPRAFAAARTPLNWRCNLTNCFPSFLSSRLIVARRSMNPPEEIYINRSRCTRRTARGKLLGSLGGGFTAFLVLQTAVTSAPSALAICTANVPTPPDAPSIRTLRPRLDPSLVAKTLQGRGCRD
jgi:hypothetical protein